MAQMKNADTSMQNGPDATASSDMVTQEKNKHQGMRASGSYLGQYGIPQTHNGAVPDTAATPLLRTSCALGGHGVSQANCLVKASDQKRLIFANMHPRQHDRIAQLQYNMENASLSSYSNQSRQCHGPEFIARV